MSEHLPEKPPPVKPTEEEFSQSPFPEKTYRAEVAENAGEE